MSSEPPPLHQAILQTLAYADVFDYPLTAPEIHRYLVGIPTTLTTVHDTLTNGLQRSNTIAQSGEYFTFPGREGLTETRARRATQAARLWPHAMHYGHLLAHFPFTRMVALTGALAVNNVEDGADIDYFIVTEPGRLWLCRALIIGLVRLTARRGIILCPNFFLAENALELPDRSLYTAREMAQMIPLSGMDIYHRIRQANAWVCDLLPNAGGPPPRIIPTPPTRSAPLKKVAETVLRTPLGGKIESWEMNRKIQKFTSQFPTTTETRFSADRCQGHFDGYGKKTMEAFQSRVEAVSMEEGNRRDS